MGKLYLASMRLAFALTCVGASLILGAHWFGFLPDLAAARTHARTALSETIAVNAAAHVRKQQWVDLASTLKTQVDRNPELISIGVRGSLGGLRVDTGHHAEVWATRAQATETQGKPSRIDAVEVPITLNRRPWGKVELAFQQPHATKLARIMNHPLVRLVMFFAVAGLISYTLFMVRIFGLFNSTQVVPDRVRQALDTLAEGLLVLDEHGHIVLANRAFQDITATAEADIVGESAIQLNWMSEDIADETYPWIDAISTAKVQTEKIIRYEMESGEQRIFSVNATPLGKDNSQRGALATFRDVTHVEEHRAELERMLGLLRSSRDEIKRKNCELEVLATQDALTGCLNRRAFFENFESLWTESKVMDSPLACLMIDVDHFKNVNDTYGHHAGDDVLRAVSQAIRTVHEGAGLVCRYGGEEFCVVLPHTDLETAIEKAELTRVTIAAIRLLDPADLRLTASVGVSEMRFNPNDAQDFINQADTCLYVAKREGRNRVVSYNPRLASTPEVSQQINESKRDRIDISYRTVTALITALSYRDTNTAEHSRRVADLCARSAGGLLNPADTYILEIAALLHDIGKIGVPDNILLKPGPLTEAEWRCMNRHDRMSAEIIANAFECSELTEIISMYHSVLNDSSDEKANIASLSARLLAIADSYDAMVSDRVYRKGRSHEEAISELRRCAGTQFDEELVEHFAERITMSSPETAAGALAIRKQNAIQIGRQIELLASAVATQDTESLRSLSSSLRDIAHDCHMDSIAAAATKIESEVAKEETQWIELIHDTHELLDTCLHAQAEFLKTTLELEGEHINQ